jgi:23S rRNA (uridine2552-2'-O)-methyltransferase
MPAKKKDFYYNKAKQMGYRSRASFKLQYINDKFNLIKKGDAVVDLGAAPGGWLQVAKEISEGPVIGVDLLRIEPIEGVITIKGDMTTQVTQAKIFEKVEKVNVVICDAAPNVSGNWALDHGRSIDLSKTALEVAAKILAPGGNFLVKVFQGDLYQGFVDEIGKRFSKVYSYKSPASREQSAEIYVIGKGFLTAGVRKGDVLSVTIDGVGKDGDGIAHVDGGFVIFVKGAKVGSKVKIKITDMKPEFGFGRIEK